MALRRFDAGSLTQSAGWREGVLNPKDAKILWVWRGVRWNVEDGDCAPSSRDIVQPIGWSDGLERTRKFDEEIPGTVLIGWRAHVSVGN